MRILGIDEAGRGAIVGPLVIAGAMIEKKDQKMLKEIGVKDSKMLTPEKREELYKKLRKIVKFKIIVISPEEIDNRIGITNLNLIEASKFAEIIDDMKPDEAIIDTPTKNTNKFKMLMKSLINHKCKLVCENFADVNHPIVSAASIIAKVNRDKFVRKIEKETGEVIGVGYPHDQKTIEFVRKSLKKPEWRKYIRKSWITFQKIKEESEQRKLGKWMK